jgi:hypothetical protein
MADGETSGLGGEVSLSVSLPVEEVVSAEEMETASGTPDPRRTETFAHQAATSRIPEPTPLTVYRAVPQVPPPLLQ